MALEAVVNHQDFFGYSSKDLYNLLGGSLCYDFDLQGKITDEENSPQLEHFSGPNVASELEISSENCPDEFGQLYSTSTTTSRSRRRRSRTKKNQEEIENQRMAHIAVERNRRKQMNEYLSVLRGLMPDSYVLKNDQASIIGGAIDYVKELEQELQFLGSQNYLSRNCEAGSSSPFSELLTFPQYTTSMTSNNAMTSMTNLVSNPFAEQNRFAAAADIEVTMVENHANLKVRSRKRPKQLLKMVSGLQSFRLTVLHLNVTTIDQTVLYSLSLKVEDDCNLISVDDIAAAVNHILSRIQEEAYA